MGTVCPQLPNFTPAVQASLIVHVAGESGADIPLMYTYSPVILLCNISCFFFPSNTPTLAKYQQNT